ncbi:MAG: hypothetical protein QF718_00135 [Phycisphaerales bacterium]|nr:hypothetical protein [Phycisphaerales bacterium]
MEPYDEQQFADSAWSFLRSNTTSTVQFGEHTCDVSYIISYQGKLVIPAMVAMLQPCDKIMFVPEYLNDCMEINITLNQFSEDGSGGELADRWRIYHGEPPDVQWALVDIDAARFHEKFIDGEGLCRENTLADSEHELCKELNAKFTDDVRTICLEETSVEVTNPVVVGVDSLGIDVRAPFGIVRIPTNESFTSADEVIAIFRDAK